MAFDDAIEPGPSGRQYAQGDDSHLSSTEFRHDENT